MSERFTEWYNTSSHPMYYFGKTCVIMPCRDRNEFLVHSLPAWLSQSYQRFELVVVDYNSKRSVYADLLPLADRFNVSIEKDPPSEKDRYHEYSKITVITVPGVKQWNMSHALNYAIRRTTSDVISVVGCDSVPDQRYLELALHMVGDKKVASVWCGRVTFPRKVWYELNGYQEICTGWGYEDNDWRFRLTRSGYTIEEMNVMMCPSVAHVSLRGRNAREDAAKNKERCQQYANFYGLIGNYCLPPGGESPIQQQRSNGHAVWLGYLREPMTEGLLTTKSCYAGKINDKTIFYILPEQQSDCIWSKEVEEKLVRSKVVHLDSPVWRALELVHDEEWRNKQIDWSTGVQV